MAHLAGFPTFSYRWSGAPTICVKRLFDEIKFQKSNIFLEGSRHPNFMNPFEYGTSFYNKSFPKRIGKLTALGQIFQTQ